MTDSDVPRTSLDSPTPSKLDVLTLGGRMAQWTSLTLLGIGTCVAAEHV